MTSATLEPATVDARRVPVSWRLRPRRVPVIRQLTATECGAACLAMILGYHGRRTRLVECRDRCAGGRDGVSARTIAHAARSFGLNARAFSIEPTDLRHVPLPAIAHWNFSHFVVIERWSAGALDIVDPAAGRRRVLSAEVDSAFTGVVLTFEPTETFDARSSSDPVLWSYLRRHLLSRPLVLAQILAASVLLQLLGLLLPTLTAVFVDYVFPLEMSELLPLLGVGIGVFSVAHLLTVYMRAALIGFIQSHLDMQLMLGFLGHLLSLPVSFFAQRPSGDLLQRLGSNLVVRELLAGQTLSLILDAGLVLTYLVVLLAREPVLGLTAVVIGSAQVGLVLATTSRATGLLQTHLAAQAQSQSYLHEALSGIRTVKASGSESRVLEHWSNLLLREVNAASTRSHLAAIVESGTSTLRLLGPLLLLWIGAQRVLAGELSAGTMLGLQVLAASALAPLASALLNAQRLQMVSAHLERLGDVLGAEPEQTLGPVRDTPRLRGAIELQGVSFAYDAQSPLILRNVSLRVEPGQKVAIVGATGSGKSTLGSLMLGLHAPTEGEVLYDGLRLRELDYRSVRSQFGVVLQEPFLFSESIRRNIAFGDPSLPLERVMQAARLAEVHDEIVSMPMGYETSPGEAGNAISGGQQQRLALARALALSPAILLLDEATSQLDAATEQRVEHHLSQLACTRIVIAHRLSTVRDADLIVVLDRGQIVERGTHASLLAQQGLYAALVARQTDAPSPAD